jgi:hypothetical protein
MDMTHSIFERMPGYGKPALMARTKVTVVAAVVLQACNNLRRKVP